MPLTVSGTTSCLPFLTLLSFISNNNMDTIIKCFIPFYHNLDVVNCITLFHYDNSFRLFFFIAVIVFIITNYLTTIATVRIIHITILLLLLPTLLLSFSLWDLLWLLFSLSLTQLSLSRLNCFWLCSSERYAKEYFSVWVYVTPNLVEPFYKSTMSEKKPISCY